MRLLPGLHVLTDKVPELATPRGLLRAVVTVLGTLIISLAVLTFLDQRWPFAAIVAQVVIYGATFLLLRDFFSPRRGLAYAEAFFNRDLPAIGLNGASLLFIYATLGAPVDQGQAAPVIPYVVQLVLFLYFLITGVGLVLATVRTAGIDTIAGVYMYYPDEGHRLQASVYEVVRHPTYAGLARIAVALAVADGTPFSLFLAALFVFAWLPRWRSLEESELVARFGEDYREYMNRVPALFPASLEMELELLRSVLRARRELPVAEEGAA